MNTLDEALDILDSVLVKEFEDDIVAGTHRIENIDILFSVLTHNMDKFGKTNLFHCFINKGITDIYTMAQMIINSLYERKRTRDV